MFATIDKAGRVVIPAQIRSEAGLRPGMELEIVREGSSVRLIPNVSRPELVRKGARWIARPTVAQKERSQVDVAELIAGERNRWPW
jgi:AbrB family looped-hinge helix DNA binding protein